jgi:hypothetical protein
LLDAICTRLPPPAAWALELDGDGDDGPRLRLDYLSLTRRERVGERPLCGSEHRLG